MILRRNYIEGQWVEGAEEIENRNPARPAEIIGRFAQASEIQVQQAIAAARAAAPAWARMNPQLRSDTYNEFIETVSTRLASLKIDDPLKKGTDIDPVVDQQQLAQDLSYIEIGKSEGAHLHCGGEQIQHEDGGYSLSPALFTHVTPQMRIAREEIFGPVAGVIRVRNYDEALSVANDTEFGLSAGICTSSLKYAAHFRRNAQAGMVMVNMPTAGVDYHVPFGGTKPAAL